MNEKQIIYSRVYKNEYDTPIRREFKKHKLLGVEYSDSYYRVYIDVEGYWHSFRFKDKKMARRAYNAFDHLFKILNINVTRKNKLADKNTF
ncbi:MULTISPECIES: hypothetical protein [Tenacibaculum]|uniref:hypothetical protein n=1 Tax=Tenacibaculum TaxID=104267 RepID=UPI001F0B4A3A|nr:MULTISPECIES: hypothetical protein [Tenacibaculum]MCH3882970.1 hypothetical protein [Tenacibaculum aquimarinum]MCH3885461.1 hypothetical protein [Tenacibaculum aquimarinum]MDO6600768.1 hypothetical protein [Tenacibaculum sp. 1_MG-2023]